MSSFTIRLFGWGVVSIRGTVGLYFTTRSPVTLLKSINGAALPYTRTLGTATLRVTNDVLLLRRDGTYEDSTTYAIPSGNSTQISTSIERGKYTISSGTIAFNDRTSGGRYSGMIQGTTLTQSVNGLTPVYEQR